MTTIKNWKYVMCCVAYFENNYNTNRVARWPHGCRSQCSEVAAPALVGSNLTEGGGFFPRNEPPPGHGCVCMSFRG
jgi:hypothetical protein